MTHSFTGMTLTQLHEMKNSLTEAIFQKELKEENKQDIDSTKGLRDFVKKHKKVKIEANIPVVIEYDLSSDMGDYYGSYIENLQDMFEICCITGSVWAGKGLKPKIKTLINEQLENMEICSEAIRLFKPDLWKQMVTDFEEFLKMKS
jgi:hypothetical protein